MRSVESVFEQAMQHTGTQRSNLVSHVCCQPFRRILLWRMPKLPPNGTKKSSIASSHTIAARQLQSRRRKCSNDLIASFWEARYEAPVSTGGR